MFDGEIDIAFQDLVKSLNKEVKYEKCHEDINR